MLNMVALDDYLHHVPLAVRLFDFTIWIAIPRHVLPRPFANPYNSGRRVRRARHALPIRARQRRTVRHIEIAGLSLTNLVFDRGRPNLLRALNVIQNSAVPGHSLTWRMSRLAPLELSPQIVILKLPLGNQVSELRAGNVDHAFLDGENMFGIIVQYPGLEKAIEVVETLAVEQNNRLSVRGHVRAFITRYRRQRPHCDCHRAADNRDDHPSANMLHFAPL